MSISNFGAIVAICAALYGIFSAVPEVKEAFLTLVYGDKGEYTDENGNWERHHRDEGRYKWPNCGTIRSC